MKDWQLALTVSLVFALTAARALAQTGPFTIRIVPQPNQTLHMRMTQDSAFTTEGDGTVAAAAMAMNMNVRTVVDLITEIGPTDSQGHYTARMSVGEVTLSVTQNGKPMDPPGLPDFPRPVTTFVYDDQGKVLDVSIEGGGPANDALKQVMKGAFTTLAPITLAIGESVTVPSALNLPLPAPGAGGMNGMAMTGETRYTLTGVTFDGADRIAHLTAHTTTTMRPESGAGSGTAIDMKTSGDSKMDVNIDRGIVTHMEQQSTMDNSMQMPSAGKGAAPSSIRMHGTLSSVSDLVK